MASSLTTGRAAISLMTRGRAQLCLTKSLRQISFARPVLSSDALSSESHLKMPSCDFQPEVHKGTSYQDTIELRKKFLTPSLLTYYKNPIFIHQGHHQWLFDTDGKRYLDLFGGIVTVSVGHCHPRINKAAHDQIDKLWHTTNIYLHPPIHEYAEKLTAKLPGNLKVCYFVNSGSEANDLAIMMARSYTGAFDIINLRNSYHGASYSTMGLLGHSNWRQNIPHGFGNFATANPDVYKGAWGGSKCRDSPIQADRDCNCSPGECLACDRYIDQLQEVLDYQVPSKIAGFFAEPIQGVGGTVQYPKQYLKRAYEKIREKGGICIADEVQTGFGRTGEHYWGFEGHGVMPDIVTMAKGIANGFPMAAVVTTAEIARSLASAVHFNTYGGNPMSCAVSSAVIDVIDDEKLQQNADVVGTDLLKKYALLRDEFEVVGDVRGKGLMIGIELVDNKETKHPLNPNRVSDIWERTKDYGVLFGKGGRFGNVLRVKPPMCLTPEDAEFSYHVLRRAIAEHMLEQDTP
eukprot:gene18972-20879_t